jgi:hypothetical protein
MALRNAVKASLLLELEQPRSRFDEADATLDAPAPVAPPAPMTTPAPVAKRPAEKAKPASGEAFLAASWHERAEALCALAETLPSKGSWSLISKIAGLYDELARDDGWCEEEEAAPPPEEPRLEEPETEAEPPAVAPPPAPPPIAFQRRPLAGRSVPRRRA